MTLHGDEAYAAMLHQLFANECDCPDEPCPCTDAIMHRLTFETEEHWPEEIDEIEQEK
jgi:hypothetical protein